MADNGKGNGILVGLQQICAHYGLSKPTLINLMNHQIKVLVENKPRLYRKFPHSKICGKYYATIKGIDKWFEDLENFQIIHEPGQEFEDDE